MAFPPKTRKAIPTDPVKWRRELDGVRRFIAQLRASDCGEGQDWQDRMHAYYSQRLEDLKDNAPTSRKRQRRRRTT